MIFKQTPSEEDRADLVGRLVLSLESAIPDSKASLRGSLVEGRADYYSDIDLRWIVPDTAFEIATNNLINILCKVTSVEKLRIDPELALSTKRRLFFVRFNEIPLFWRLDLEIITESIKDIPDYDLGNPSVVDFTGWDWAESALANAVAAIKVHKRGQETQAQELMQRAFQRVGLKCPQVGLKEQILQLTRTVQKESNIEKLVERVTRLTEEYL